MSGMYMDETKSKKVRKVRVWGKGQLTIPAEIRNALDIGENTYLEIFRAGNAIIATPEKIMVKELADSVKREMNKNNINLESLLEELREGSHQYEK
ncbi:AbrB/MazE/SpoVT family DNA-binding domain-containing protein [Pelotomaculum terephthalicicum JT]|uniref:AbrB/MazE/SpoVT family DNA-binding domain-containing protein n=1 Tax=Pelotomaculum TaxID=191373 RepID=UPI0009C77188|nr:MULTISPECIES: AbrB/MazE/SpoVT family DNA-binding domain-containing protein [Pelotomaculum]MCG9968203.1 AbrB/MazE/SpoVT family DNA-binding domain-containing protein [Pelotomaculum terephthalicicum JT]OPX89108.1 MAG: SpoVT / AbrB like domain protein [Pelotomaculum sp. PtaB.Bin117]OPY59978.1 MAG: SpoVT / AbrB like domain protein [Pelotomaculum sp. PtaU1.Bin065]